MVGRLISPRPARGPDDNRRRSLQVFDSFTATRLSTPESCTKLPQSCEASTRLSAVDTGTPLMRAQMAAGDMGVIRVGVDAGANGRGAQIDFGNQQRRLAQPGFVLAQHHRISAKLLAQRHRHRVLQLGAAHFQHIGKRLGAVGKRLAQIGHRLAQAADAKVGGQLQCGGVNIIGALAEVDVLMRVQVLIVAALVAHQLQRTVGDHFVGVHIGGGAGAALDHIHHKMLVQRAGADFGAGGDNRPALGLGQQAQLGIGFGGGLLDAGQRANQLRDTPKSARR